MSHPDDDHLTVLLARAAGQLQVGPPPTRRLLTNRRRVHRRQALARSALGAVVALVVMAGAVVGISGGDGGVDRVVPAGPRPSASPLPSTFIRLDGTWTVTAITGSDPATSALPVSYRGRVRFTFDHGKLSGDTGCNAFGAAYTQSGERGENIRFTRESTTQVLCRDEPPVLDRLDAVRHVSGTGSTRYLSTDDRQIIFELELG